MLAKYIAPLLRSFGYDNRTGFVQKKEIKIPGLFKDFSRTIYIFPGVIS